MTQQSNPQTGRAKTRHPALAAALSSPVLLGVAGLLITLFGELPNALRWPARFLILFCGALGLWKFPGESRWLVNRAAGLLAAARDRAADWIERRAGALGRAERALAAAAIAVALVPFFLMIRDMSWSSLRTDEISSVSRFSSQGPWHVMSNYQRANNHILFNLLNSVTPWPDSMHPVRARFWSFVAMTALVAAAGLWLWRRSPAGAAWMLCAICLNTYHLHLELQARAYGMASLLAFLAAAGFLKCQTEEGQEESKGLALLGAATALGTYAVPFFVVFGGLLLLWLFIERPSASRFLAGFWALCAIALLHLPVLSQILEVAASYDEDYEAGFASASSGWSVLYYLVPGGLPFQTIGHSAVFMTALLFAALLPAVAGSRRARAGMVVAAASVAFVAFCYVLESPPRRVAAFVVAPFALGLVWAGIGVFSSFRALRPWGRLAAPVACAGLAAFGLWRVKVYEFEPTQRWREFGRALTLLYPGGVDVWVDTDLRNNQAYLDERFTVTEGGSFDLARFKAGALVVHDANYSLRTKERDIAQADLTPDAVRLPFDTSGGETVLWLQPQMAFEVAPKLSGDVARYETGFEPAQQSRGAVFLFNGAPSDLSVLVKTADGGWTPLDRRNWFRDGRHLFLRLPAGASGAAVEAKFCPGAEGPARFVLPKRSPGRAP